MSQIAILLPVLGRPGQARRVMHTIRNSSAERHRAIFLCSPGDIEEIKACRRTDADVITMAWPAGPGDFARKINHGLEISDEPFVFCGADDLTFTQGWDVEALAVAEETGAGVIGTWDGANPMTMRGRHATHPLVSREYIHDQGGTVDDTGAIYCELYDHQCVDNELVEVAQARGQWAFAHASRVLHHHPIFDRTITMDKTYEKGLAKGREDRALFMKRRRLWNSRTRVRR